MLCVYYEKELNKKKKRVNSPVPPTKCALPVEAVDGIVVLRVTEYEFDSLAGCVG